MALRRLLFHILAILLPVIPYALSGPIPTEPDTTRALIRAGLSLHEVTCNGDGMKVKTIDHMPLCTCPAGSYLKVRNINDPNTWTCVPCRPCNPKGVWPHERQKCGLYSPTVCCPYANMTVEMTSHGFFDCAMPPSDGSTDPKPVECHDGFFLNGTVCDPCTVCANLLNTSYEGRPCSNVSNTVCCARDDDTAVEIRPGIFQCRDTASDPSTRSHSNDVATDAADSADLEETGRGGSDPTGSPVSPNVTDSHLGGGDRDGHSGSGEEEKKDKYPKLGFRLFIVGILIMLTTLALYCHYPRIRTFYGNNSHHIEKIRRKLERLVTWPKQKDSPVEMQPLNSGVRAVHG